ncbi:MAG: hypothetical protein ABIB71_05700 [Candidatus Woesearchaeota archaeon]
MKTYKDWKKFMEDPEKWKMPGLEDIQKLSVQDTDLEQKLTKDLPKPFPSAIEYHVVSKDEWDKAETDESYGLVSSYSFKERKITSKKITSDGVGLEYSVIVPKQDTLSCKAILNDEEGIKFLRHLFGGEENARKPLEAYKKPIRPLYLGEPQFPTEEDYSCSGRSREVKKEKK